MRTTLTLDDDILRAARSLARARAVSLGTAVSDLARQGLTSTRSDESDDFPSFRVSPTARPITLEDVKRAEEEF